MSNVVDLHGRSIPIDDDELVEDLARFADGTLSEAAVKSRHHLSNEDWATPEQAKAAFEGYSAYFGTYFVDEATATVTHRRTGNINPGDMGDFVRKVEFRENLLILCSETNNTITWERVTK
jgi:hypothetical protein